MNSAQPLTALINCMKLLQDEFGAAFDSADKLYFTDIYSAGEKPIKGVDGRLLPGKVKEHIPEKEICYAPDLQALVRELYEDARPGDMIFTMGAGNIYQAGEALIQLIREKGLADDYKK